MPKVTSHYRSETSSTVADPSTVTIWIENVSRSDLNVQDVVTTSVSDDDEADDLQQRRQKTSHDQFSCRISSLSSHRRTSLSRINKNSFQQQYPKCLSTKVTNPVRILQNQPITANSLSAKSLAFNNERGPDSTSTFLYSAQRSNSSRSSLSSENLHIKSSIQSVIPHQLVPTIFTTTSKCLDKKCRPQPSLDVSMCVQPLAKSASINSNPSPSTISIVFLTDEILLGSIRALQNERQLCKLSVDYLIDATNMRPDEGARKAKIGVGLQCHCGHKHSRCTLTLEFNQSVFPTKSTTPIDHSSLNRSKIHESSHTQLDQIFSTVNCFISKARRQGKRILIYGFELVPNSTLAVIAIQYLMLNDEQLSLIEATNRIHRLFPTIPSQHQQYPSMEKHFQDYLKQLTRKRSSKFTVISNKRNDDSSRIERKQELDDCPSNSPATTAATNNATATSWTAVPVPIANVSNNLSLQLFTPRSAWDN